MKAMKKIQLYFNTVRYLRPTQIYHRFLFNTLPPPKLLPKLAPALRKQKLDKWARPVQRQQSLFKEDVFQFLNEKYSLNKTGWNNAKIEKLWIYNLHYFDDLNASGAHQRRAQHEQLLRRWVHDNPPTQGNGWEPYPTSLRIVNWIKWQLQGPVVEKPVLDSLAMQTRWLTKRLEYHILGNHLFANAKALVFSGLYFDGDEADRWLQTGIRIIQAQLEEQILPDGGHFERSTMYHSLALEDVLDLLNIFGVYADVPVKNKTQLIEKLQKYAASMQQWLHAMCHPDGEISFFNDAAIGIAPSPDELEAYAQRLGYVSAERIKLPFEHFKQSGYIRIQRNAMLALLDVAKIGPDYLPGHAHADTLSFEMSVHQQRVLVNSGTSCYGLSAERLRQRGTKSHNTVCVSDQNSSEIWSSFRVARRAKPFDLKVERNSVIKIQCAHNGYFRLPGRPHHNRAWLIEDAKITITDTVSNPSLVSEAFYHFHPDVQVAIDEGLRSGNVTLNCGHVVAWNIKCGEAVLQSDTYHPEFGVSIESKCLVVRLVNGVSEVSFHWA